MPLSIIQWHERYSQQAEWTQYIRNYIYDRISLSSAKKILDVGCGTGVLEAELNALTIASIYGVDIDSTTIKFAHDYAGTSIYSVGDCFYLPYASGSFDITLCHFLLLWVGDVEKALKEMIRVTCKGGFVLALAEPDYGGRIDYPSELSRIGSWQREALANQGANPFIGRELRSVYSNAGMSSIEVGILGGQWNEASSDLNFEMEWRVIQEDLSDTSEFLQEAEKLRKIEILSRHNRQRILYVPTFYAYGVVK